MNDVALHSHSTNFLFYSRLDMLNGIILIMSNSNILQKVLFEIYLFHPHKPFSSNDPIF